MKLKQAKKIFNNTIEKQLEKKELTPQEKEWIQLKDKHSREVLKTGLEIISVEKTLSSLNSHLLETAKCALLLHDIGRFYQFKNGQYNKDLWHGNHGVEVLLEKNNITYDPYLLLPIKYHDKIDFSEMYLEQNYLRLKNNARENVLLIAKLVRDADKIANYRMFSEEEMIISSGRKRNLLITPEILLKLYEKKLVNNKFKKTCFDSAIGFLCWQFDLFFDVSRSIIKKENITERIISKMKDWVVKVSDELIEQGGDVKIIQIQAAVLNKEIDKMKEFLVSVTNS